MNDTVHKTRTVLVDGLQVEATDASATAIEKLLNERKTLSDAAVAREAEHQKALAAKDAKIDELSKQVLTDAQLDKLVAERIAFADKARKIDPKVVVDGKSMADVRREIVVAKLGDAMKAKDDAYIEARFDILADADPVRQPGGTFPLQPTQLNISASDKAWAEANAAQSQAWMRDAKTGS